MGCRDLRLDGNGSLQTPSHHTKAGTRETSSSLVPAHPTLPTPHQNPTWHLPGRGQKGTLTSLPHSLTVLTCVSTGNLSWQTSSYREVKLQGRLKVTQTKAEAGFEPRSVQLQSHVPGTKSHPYTLPTPPPSPAPGTAARLWAKAWLCHLLPSLHTCTRCLLFSHAPSLGPEVTMCPPPNTSLTSGYCPEKSQHVAGLSQQRPGGTRSRGPEHRRWGQTGSKLDLSFLSWRSWEVR